MSRIARSSLLAVEPPGELVEVRPPGGRRRAEAGLLGVLLGGVVGAEVDGDGGVEAGHDPVEGALLQAHVVHLQNVRGQTVLVPEDLSVY